MSFQAARRRGTRVEVRCVLGDSKVQRRPDLPRRAARLPGGGSKASAGRRPTARAGGDQASLPLAHPAQPREWTEEAPRAPPTGRHTPSGSRLNQGGIKRKTSGFKNGGRARPKKTEPRPGDRGLRPSSQGLEENLRPACGLRWPPGGQPDVACKPVKQQAKTRSH